jgi:hypothetical protein
MKAVQLHKEIRTSSRQLNDGGAAVLQLAQIASGGNLTKVQHDLAKAQKTADPAYIALLAQSPLGLIPPGVSNYEKKYHLLPVSGNCAAAEALCGIPSRDVVTRMSRAKSGTPLSDSILVLASGAKGLPIESMNQLYDEVIKEQVVTDEVAGALLVLYSQILDTEIQGLAVKFLSAGPQARGLYVSEVTRAQLVFLAAAHDLDIAEVNYLAAQVMRDMEEWYVFPLVQSAVLSAQLPEEKRESLEGLKWLAGREGSGTTDAAALLVLSMVIDEFSKHQPGTRLFPVQSIRPAGKSVFFVVSAYVLPQDKGLETPAIDVRTSPATDEDEGS